MPDDPQYTPPPWMVEIVLREVGPVAEKALRAYGVGKKAIEATDEIKERLAELCGKSGRNGIVGRAREDIVRINARLDSIESTQVEQGEALAAGSTERKLMARSGLYGAGAGGGIVLIIAEVLRQILGG